jgi:hypothetical protein
VVVTVGVAVGFKTEVELNVAPGDQTYVTGNVLPVEPPPHAVTLAEVVCPPVIDPVLTMFPLQEIVYVALLSLNVPCVSNEKEKGPVPGLLIVTVLVDPVVYGPPEPTTVPAALLMLHEVSSKKLVPEIVKVKLEVLPPLDPVPAATDPDKTVG